MNNTRARKERIYKALTDLTSAGIISDDLVVQGNMPGLRWTFTPTGYSPRSMTTNEVEWFIMGASAAAYKQPESVYTSVNWRKPYG